MRCLTGGDFSGTKACLSARKFVVDEKDLKIVGRLCMMHIIK